ncbi:BON domain-containing protein [Gimesia panareensis]
MNEQLSHRIKSLYQTSGYRTLSRVRVDVNQDEVSLEGQVPTYFIKQVAQSLILALDQSKQVHNRLTVENGFQAYR